MKPVSAASGKVITRQNFHYQSGHNRAQFFEVNNDLPIGLSPSPQRSMFRAALIERSKRATSDRSNTLPLDIFIDFPVCNSLFLKVCKSFHEITFSKKIHKYLAFSVIEVCKAKRPNKMENWRQ